MRWIHLVAGGDIEDMKIPDEINRSSSRQTVDWVIKYDDADNRGELKARGCQPVKVYNLYPT